MRQKIDSTVRWLLIILMSLLVVDVVWQVFSRYIVQSPSTFTDELARFLLIWVSLLGAAYYSGQNMHIAIRMLPDRLSKDKKRHLELFSAVIIILFVFAVFVVGGSILVYTTYIYTQITPALQIPMALVYCIGPISGLLIVYYKISDIILLLKGEEVYKPQPEAPQ